MLTCKRGFMNKLKFVKALVFFLTLTIIFGMILVGNAIYRKTQRTKITETTVLNLAQPRGSKISDIKTTDNMIHLLIRGGKQSDRIISVRTLDNSVASIINLTQD